MRARSRYIRYYVDHETDNCGHKHEREYRVEQCNPPNGGGRNRNVRRLVAHRYRERIIHEVPVVGNLPVWILKTKVKFGVVIRDRVIVVHPHVMDAKIYMT